MTRAHSAVARIDQTVMRVRGYLVSGWIRLWGGSVGSGLMVDRRVRFRHPPGSSWEIGSNVYFGTGAILDVWPGARLAIGSGSKIMQYTVIGARESVEIGAHCQIAEFTSIRDADHGVAGGDLITHADMIQSRVTLGDDVWIARGCAVLRGSTIGTGCVIGANSVVRGEIEPMSIAVGAPARVVKRRGEEAPSVTTLSAEPPSE